MEPSLPDGFEEAHTFAHFGCGALNANMAGGNQYNNNSTGNQNVGPGNQYIGTNHIVINPGNTDRKEKIMKMLSNESINMEKTYQGHYNIWQKDTGQWIFDSEAFQNWYHGHHKRLWYHGIPGIGKTIHATNIIHHLRKMQEKERRNIGLAFLYCSQQDEPQNAVGLLRGILYQLSQSLEISGSLATLYERYTTRNNTQPTLDEYLATLKNEVRRFESVYIVVDALDECSARKENKSSPNPSTRIELHKALKDLGDNVHLLFTSRDVSAGSLGMDIVYRLDSFKSVEVKAKNDDIELCLRQRIGYDEYLRSLGREMEDSIVRAVLEKASGMYGDLSRSAFVHLLTLYRFLPAHLQMELIERIAQNEINLEAVKGALKDLPVNLKDAYWRVFKNILDESRPGSPIAHKILACLALHKDRRHIEESMVQCVIALDKTSAIHRDRLTPEHSLADSCQGLVVIEPWKKQIRLFHSTAQEYASTTETQQEFFSEDSLWFASLLIRYLSTNDDPKDATWETRDNKPVKSTTALDESLYAYARANWGFHAKPIERKLMGPIREFIESKIRFERCFRASFPDYKRSTTGGHSDANLSPVMEITGGTFNTVDLGYTSQAPTSAGPEDYSLALHACAYFDLQLTVKSLLMQGVNIEVKDSQGYNALRFAAIGRAEQTVALLLQNNADVFSTDLKGRSTMHWALDTSYPVDLTFGGTYGVRDGDYYYVEAATVTGVEHRDSDLSNSAGFNTSKIIVDQLLDRMLRYKKKRFVNQLLSVAAADWHWQIVQRLLEAGADVNVAQKVRGDALLTPLLWALQTPQTRRMEYCSRIHVTGGRATDEHTAHTAVNITGLDRHDMTPRQLEMWKEASLKIPTLIGNKIDMRNEVKRTALSLAVENRFFEVAKILLNKGADPNSRDRLGMTPLHWSSCLPRLRTIYIFDLAFFNNDHVICTAISRNTEVPPAEETAVRFQAGELTRLLLDMKADKTLKNMYGATALELANAAGLKSVALLLQDLPASISVNEVEESHRLQWATFGHPPPTFIIGHIRLNGSTKLIIPNVQMIEDIIASGDSMFLLGCGA